MGEELEGRCDITIKVLIHMLQLVSPYFLLKNFIYMMPAPVIFFRFVQQILIDKQTNLFRKSSFQLLKWNLSMNIHSCHIRFIISPNHTQKFPAISFIKTCMVCNQIDRGYPFGLHILYNYIK